MVQLSRTNDHLKFHFKRRKKTYIPGRLTNGSLRKGVISKGNACLPTTIFQGTFVSFLGEVLVLSRVYISDLHYFSQACLHHAEGTFIRDILCGGETSGSQGNKPTGPLLDFQKLLSWDLTKSWHLWIGSNTRDDAGMTVFVFFCWYV